MTFRRETLKILVVDDNSDQARSLAMLLQATGYEAHSCDHSKNCMAIVEQMRPDAILLDLEMPSMSGFDIAEELQMNPDLRPACLIAVTGHVDIEDRKRTSSSGFDHHLAKPVSLLVLTTILNSISKK